MSLCLVVLMAIAELSDVVCFFLHRTRCFLQLWCCLLHHHHHHQVVFTPQCHTWWCSVGTLKICQWSKQNGWQSVLQERHWKLHRQWEFPVSWACSLFISGYLLDCRTMEPITRYLAWMQLSAKISCSSVMCFSLHWDNACTRCWLAITELSFAGTGWWSCKKRNTHQVVLLVLEGAAAL